MKKTWLIPQQIQAFIGKTTKNAYKTILATKTVSTTLSADTSKKTLTTQKTALKI